ncbi:methyltransferase domain-containing protein [bacterium]|nr:methyltransferase domain-containing protein [bacterium]
MKADESKWNRRYSMKEFPHDPAEIVTNNFQLAEKGNALDIAAGNGRNSLFLADKGFEVDAVDISGVALDIIREKDKRINPIHEDLDSYQIKTDYYNLIINVNYLQRRLFPHIKDGLKKNGVLIFQTFLELSPDSPNYDISKKDQFLKVNELLHAFLSLQVIYYKEQEVRFYNGEKMRAAALVVQKK